MFKLIIAGGRDFNNYDGMSKCLDRLLKNINDNIEIVCGMARGADRLGERYAKEHGYKVIYMPADWDLYGKSAGFKRNVQMAEYADALVAFWDGVSSGTKHMIETAQKMGLDVRVKKVPNGKEEFHMNELKKYEELKNKLHDAVNELCVLCGKYQFEHVGMCDGCRWKQEKRTWTKE